MEQPTTTGHHRWTLVAALGLPFALIMGVYLMSVWQSASLDTDYDFVYAVCDSGSVSYGYRYCDTYLNELIQIDENGQYSRGTINPDRDSNNDGVKDVDEAFKVRFFFHDTTENRSTEISEADLSRYTFSDFLISPDGATVERGYQRSPDFLLFDIGSNGYEYELVRDGRGRVLNLVGDHDRWYYQEQFEFVGWVISN